jgi:hypothetical protein
MTTGTGFADSDGAKAIVVGSVVGVPPEARHHATAGTPDRTAPQSNKATANATVRAHHARSLSRLPSMAFMIPFAPVHAALNREAATRPPAGTVFLAIPRGLRL